MAGLFDNQAKLYAAGRPGYPEELFSFIATKTPLRERVWDVGAGSGQASVMLANYYRQVIGTDISESQLQYAQLRENVSYVHTPVSMAEDEIVKIVGGEHSLDLVTVAQAVQWFDLESFYPLVKRVLKQNSGVFAAWCYTAAPRTCPEVDEVFWEFDTESGPYWAPARKIVDDEYKNLPFPFDPVSEGSGTGPFRFEYKTDMDVDRFVTYLSSMSVLQCARKQGMELLPESRINAFGDAWGAGVIRTVTWPVFLRIGCNKSSQSQ